jgi:DNA-binding response OmpR family regulator
MAMSEGSTNEWQETCLQAVRELEPERRLAVLEKLRCILDKEIYKFGSLCVDFARSEVKQNGTLVSLSNLEFRLLRHLIEKAGSLVSREELLCSVWGYDKRAFTRTVDMHICSLRQKVEKNASRPEFIITVKGEGYKFAGLQMRHGKTGPKTDEHPDSYRLPLCVDE